MKGSTSPKSVPPTLAQEASHKKLEISDGMQAMDAFLALREEPGLEMIRRTREAQWTNASWAPSGW